MMFGLLFMMLVVPMSYGAILDPIPIDDKNETVLPDYEQLYNETKDELARYTDDYYDNPGHRFQKLLRLFFRLSDQ